MTDAVHTEERDGFTINLYLLEEPDSPRDSFDTDDVDDICDKIDSGVYMWFCAKVTASKAGIELGSDYLGGCCYESVEAFLEPDGYWPDMVATAIEEAKAKLAELAA